MAHGRPTGIAFASIAGVLALAAGARTLDLRRERAAALAEGLSVVPDVVLPQTGDPFVGAVRIFGRTAIADYRASGRAIAGAATAADRAKVMALAKRLGPTFAALRQAAKAPSTAGFLGDYEARQAGYALKHLTAAAAVGATPRSDAIVAVHLSGLLRGHPRAEDQVVGLRAGLDALAVARRLKVGREGARALGPATPVRAILRPLLPNLIAGVWQRESILGWTDPKTRLAYRRPDAEARAIAGWRRIWRSLPADPLDYAGAARRLDRELPPLEALGVTDFGFNCSACPVLYRPSEASATLRGFARLEAMRKALR